MTRVGESAWLLELAGTAQVLAARRLVESELATALRELVPGASTLLVVVDGQMATGAEIDPAQLEGIERTVRQAGVDAAPSTTARSHRIPVRYDGADLAELAARARLGRDELVARHAAAVYRVAFLGFQPGFAYLDGLPRALHAPRRQTPRPRVPAGSVAIGGEWTGIYPLESPGGWSLIGTTDQTLFTADADPPTLLQPGDVVRFVPT
jgi:KipI family sensor histidine kinase inhibitor